MRRYPIEALLRPPIELYSALAALACASLALLAPQVLMLPGGLSVGCAAGLAILGGVRTAQAVRVLRYRARLIRLPRYRLSCAHLPSREHKVFLGRGFRWSQKHTQRLRDTLHPGVQCYLRPGPLHRLLHRGASGATWRTALGGTAALHGVEPREQAVWMDRAERTGHTLVLGTTRVGKTRLAELLIAQDIARGDTVIVFDPKGDAGLLQRVYAETRRAGRCADFFLFHLGFPEHSARYNAIGNFSRITEVATRIANQLPNEGNSAAFREFAWRFVNIIARALVALGLTPNYRRVHRYINDIEPLFIEYAEAHLQRCGTPGWRKRVGEIAQTIKERNLPAALRGRSAKAIALMRYLPGHTQFDPVLDGLISAFKYDRTYFDKIVSSVGPLMEKLTTGAIADLISPGESSADARPIFEWLDVIRRQGIVYVGLDALSDTTVASAVGNSMFADLVSVAGHIYKHGTGDKARPSVSIHADEFNELIGEEFVPLLNKAGGAGFQVTAYTQTWSDVEARIGNRAKAGQVAGNFNTLIMLRVKELATARMLTDQLPEVEVHTLMSVSGVNDSAEPASGIDFRSRNEDRVSVFKVPMLSPADLITLPKGQAFALLEGGQLWKLRMPLPEAAPVQGLPQEIEDITQGMAHPARTSRG